MMADETVCRLCFKISDKGFDNIEDTIQKIINFLQLNLDLDISREPVVCDSCIDNLKKCSKFKAACLRKEDSINFSIVDQDEKLNVCLNDITRTNTIASNSSNICYFCTKLINCDSFIVLSADKSVQLTLEKYFPEVVSNITEDSTMCISCYESLQNHIAFMSTCLDIEEKIRKYCEAEGTNSVGQVELNSVLCFTPKYALHSKNYQNNEIMLEEEWCKRVKNENVEVKWEEEQELKVKDEDIKTEVEQEECDRYQDNLLCPQQQMPTNGDTSEIERVNSTMNAAQLIGESKFQKPCGLETNKIGPGGTIFKCATCAYLTKRKDHLQSHMLIHTTDSELKMYKCEMCTHQTKHKHHLSAHMLTHKSTLEIPMYKCEICVYQTKHKSNLSKHMLTHKNYTKVVTPPAPRVTANYKCNVCSYQTVRKDRYLRHNLVHKSPSEVTMYNCEVCSFQTKRKDHLPIHMLTHKGDWEVTLYKCELCSHRTKRKDHLRKHMLTHKSNSEVTTHKCKLCTFETKYKSALQTHSLTHKSYQCKVCGYRTKQRTGIEKHIVTHKTS